MSSGRVGGSGGPQKPGGRVEAPPGPLAWTAPPAPPASFPIAAQSPSGAKVVCQHYVTACMTPRSAPSQSRRRLQGAQTLAAGLRGRSARGDCSRACLLLRVCSRRPAHARRECRAVWRSEVKVNSSLTGPPRCCTWSRDPGELSPAGLPPHTPLAQPPQRPGGHTLAAVASTCWLAGPPASQARPIAAAAAAPAYSSLPPAAGGGSQRWVAAAVVSGGAPPTPTHTSPHPLPS